MDSNLGGYYEWLSWCGKCGEGDLQFLMCKIQNKVWKSRKILTVATAIVDEWNRKGENGSKTALIDQNNKGTDLPRPQELDKNFGLLNIPVNKVIVINWPSEMHKSIGECRRQRVRRNHRVLRASEFLGISQFTNEVWNLTIFWNPFIIWYPSGMQLRNKLRWHWVIFRVRLSNVIQPDKFACSVLVASCRTDFSLALAPL